MKTKTIRLIAAVVLGTALLLLFALVVYHQAPALLTVDSGPCKAGAIVVLGGDPLWRPLRAAELFAEGAAPLVIVSGDGDNEELARSLQSNGVPAVAILREDKSKSTKQNAEFTVALLKDRGITNGIIVTSWFHSRRALKTFQKVSPEMTFYSQPSKHAINSVDWSKTGTSSHIRLEYLKLVGYLVLYGVWPF